MTGFIDTSSTIITAHSQSSAEPFFLDRRGLSSFCFSFYDCLQSQSHIATDGQSISKSQCRAPCGAHDQIFITLWQLRSCFCGAPSLWREDESVFCICCWPSPASSFSGPSPLGLVTIFYSLRFETSFSSPTTRRVSLELFDPASIRVKSAKKSKSNLLYDWRFTANQFVLASSPSRRTTRDFSPIKPLRY
jgi:hypothetical protein